ncbi:hypothetical protein [Leptolyngbya sp. FACHB-16]|uniref:hypothetical protein n=1 Tax=unclassified Leptolyngbya TaxID=2650499 RepID=UPI001688F13C|nr:hypothetical protein [Leptolyngbya sp. FACHB-16]MBD2155955.1 hypothetical protein [Leptolyngbya sp. FACHB-16]
MKAGDRVRLKQLFRPSLISTQSYRFGIVVDIVSTFYNAEVLVYLYDPNTEAIYIDETGIQAIYSFQLEEIERFE